MNADQKKLEECASAQWTIISNAYETEPDERTERQRDITCCGLCFAAKRVGIWDNILDTIGCSESYHYVPQIIGSPFTFAGGDTRRERDLYRATFAAFMSVLSPKDIKEMLDEHSNV